MKRAAAFFAALLVAAPARAITVQEVQEKMSESGEKIETLQFSYAQKMTSQLTSEQQSSSGRAFLKKPRQLRIEQEKPEQQLVVTSGKSVYVYTPRFQQVIKDKWDKWSSNNFVFPGLSGFRDSLERLKKDYRWEVMGSALMDGTTTQRLRLTKSGAKDAGSEILDLWVSEGDWIPRKTELVLGTLKLTTTLTEVRSNVELQPKLFDFKKPSQSKLIEMP